MALQHLRFLSAPFSSPCTSSIRLNHHQISLQTFYQTISISIKVDDRQEIFLHNTRCNEKSSNKRLRNKRKAKQIFTFSNQKNFSNFHPLNFHVCKSQMEWKSLINFYNWKNCSKPREQNGNYAKLWWPFMTRWFVTVTSFMNDLENQRKAFITHVSTWNASRLVLDDFGQLVFRWCAVEGWTELHREIWRA